MLATGIALHGHVLPGLRAVKVDIGASNTAYFWFYWDSRAGSVPGTHICVKDICRDIGHEGLIEAKIVGLDLLSPIPQEGYYVYHRAENTPVKNELSVIDISNLSEVERLHFLLLNALLGNVTASLRAVKTDINEAKKIVYFWWYFDKSASTDTKESIYRACNNVTAAIGEEYAANITIDRLDNANNVPTIGQYVYRRRESHVLRSQKIDKDATRVESWRHLSCPSLNLYNYTATPFNNRLATARVALLGLIRPNCRAIQMSLDESTQQLYFWFYMDGDISGEDQTMVEQFFQKFQRLSKSMNLSSIEYQLQQIHVPDSLPQQGAYVFLRDESQSGSRKISQAQESVFDHFATLVQEELVVPVSAASSATFSANPNLRGIKISVNPRTKKYHLWIYFYQEIEEDMLAAKALAQKIRNKICSRSVLEAYYLSDTSEVGIANVGSFVFLPDKEKEERGTSSLPLFDQLAYVMSQALVGRVPPHLRAVKVAVDEGKKIFYIWFYFDGNISERDRKTAYDAIGCTQWLPDFFCNEEIERLDYPQEIPHIGTYVYLRHESKKTPSAFPGN